MANRCVVIYIKRDAIDVSESQESAIFEKKINSNTIIHYLNTSYQIVRSFRINYTLMHLAEVLSYISIIRVSKTVIEIIFLCFVLKKRANLSTPSTNRSLQFNIL